MKLNSEQQEAVSHTTGPLLILAGAGSGKTRVLTERIANLITNNNVLPYHILAVTFTNKAAKEMKERIASRVGEKVAKSLWIGTFHSICIRILRSEIELLGRKANFVVYDTTDQTKLISDILGKLNIDDKNFPANEVLRSISSAKSKALTAEKYSEFATSYKEQRIADIYLAYDLELKKNNALDFDDILLLVVKILEESPETLEYYQNKFKYILVDEYQDTNQVQYQLIKLLSDKYRNICAVGDVDQSIYAFRNADYRIILNFQNDYNDAKIIKLETNYRSTKNIVNLSNEIIKNNQQSFPKNLRTDNPFGDKTKIYEAYDDHSEASFIGNEIIRLVYSGNFDYDNFAILFRTNSQSRVFEKVLISNNIPYQVIGGFRFFERKEIKDLICYLKAIYNPDDNISLQRIINIPKRGIGDTTIKKLLDIADNYNISLWDVLNFQTFENISPATQSKIREFVILLAELIDQSSSISVSALLKLLLDRSEYLIELEMEDKKSSKDNSRVENVYQLINSAIDFEEDSDDTSLAQYLSYISLISDADSINEERKMVKLMTVHTSKGLEFPIVFIAGLAEGVFPHSRAVNSDSEIEEERRLMYVAITRAKDKLYLTYPKERYVYNATQKLTASRFLYECPKDLVSGFNLKNNFGEPDDIAYQENKKTNSGFYDDYGSRRKIQSNSYNSDYRNSYDSEDYYEKKKSKKLDNVAIQSSLENRYLNQSKNNTKEFFENDKVYTQRYGHGKVSKVLKNNNKVILVINFESVQGSKILDPKLTDISKI